MTYNSSAITNTGCQPGLVTQRLGGVKPLNSTDLGDDDCSNGLAHSRNAGEQFNCGFLSRREFHALLYGFNVLIYLIDQCQVLSDHPDGCRAQLLSVYQLSQPLSPGDAEQVCGWRYQIVPNQHSVDAVLALRTLSY